MGSRRKTRRPSDATPGFLIDENGNVQFPYAGNLHVAGKDRRDDPEGVAQPSEQGVSEARSDGAGGVVPPSQVYLDGEVRTPGAQSVTDIPMSLTMAINQGGGFSANADRSRVELIRNGVVYPLNVDDLIKRGHNPSDIYLQAGRHGAGGGA